MSQRWLGLDPGIARIGWAVLDNDEQTTPILLDYGTIETSKQCPTPQRLLEIETDISELLSEFKPEKVAIEMPFFSRQIKAAGGVIQALGVLNLVIYRELKIIPILLHQSSWKCHLDHGRATKEEVAEVIQSIFHLETLPIDDTVDAIAIAYAGLCGVRNQIN
ncbi:Crossover junction endodeoxyribonuclease [Gloeothece citriformis PCC 7424]|uniref:Crossover junction endodeoxyribonuclease RuvC n=1 Tax=Gloeothece citriformis (strain PCC 7424) TaxID=65393 RepID=B7KAZ2_GLOC7|nr:crossover junction endodeoxyribonuclease RuvC [Gloeothece citriformis]ACK70102.1 Crossover junction endodeoxyribonuclease [Gloeothece citriformis PCC 7424]